MHMFAFILAVTASWKLSCADCVTCEYGGTFCDDPPYPGFLPSCPENIDELRLEMFSRPATDIGQTIDPDTIPSNFDPSRRTFFVTHGYGSNFQTNWLSEMKDAFLTREDANVVIVGWGGRNGSEQLNYIEAAATTRTVGAYVGLVMLNLIGAGEGSADLMWCSGHSLGAHVMGYAGKWTQTDGGLTIARITGMDPAGPDFSDNPSPQVGLYPTDAVFVDTINTDEIYGSFPQGTGQINFFPNANDETDNNQPGCFEASCDHSRSHDLMTDSIRYPGCFPATYDCGPGSNYTSFDQCRPCSFCPFMGYDGQPSDGTGAYYLETNGDTPYCLSA